MSTERLTGTGEEPIERIPDDPSTIGRWVVAVGGPAVWMTHFMAVYLAAETTCTGLERDEWSFGSEGALIAFTAVATVAAAIACVALAVLARRRMGAGDQDRVDFAFLGFLLAIGSLIGVVAVGAPALFLSPAC